MKTKFIWKISLYLAILGFSAIFTVLAWDYLSSSEERWIYYIDDPENGFEEFPSYESCESKMDENKAPRAGCRRFDGPYKLLNSIADYLL